ncbi:Uncharacterized protein QTN25_009680 [Entamoeba marina]
MQSHQEHHKSVIFLLFLFVLITCALLSIIFSLQMQLKASPLLQPTTPLSPFAYYKGGYSVYSPNKTEATECYTADQQLKEIIVALGEKRGNLFFKYFHSTQLNESIYVDTTLQLSGNYDLDLHASCLLQEGIFNYEQLQVNEMNGTVTLLRCYTILTNWINWKEDHIRSFMSPVLSSIDVSPQNITLFPPYKNFPTLLMVFPQTGRPTFRGILNGGGDASIRIKGVAYEEQTQKNQMFVLLNVFILVYFVQSWVVIYSNNNNQSPFSFISFSIFPI